MRERRRVPGTVYFDGMLCAVGVEDLRLYRVFAPRWWQVWRWLAWWRSKERGELTVVARDGRAVRVRVLPEGRVRLPRVPVAVRH